MKNNKKLFLTIMIIVMMFLLIFMIYKKSNNKFDINNSLGNYNLNDDKVKEEYLNYIKETIYPIKLRQFINNLYINHEQYKNTATGDAIKNQMEFMGYKMLFMSMFNKSRINFDDCPVTEKFKEKFNTNLLEYFNLIASEDCESNCLLNRDKQEITVEVYGNFENTEPTYQNTHHFHYTIDNDGNVDDVVFDYTDE